MKVTICDICRKQGSEILINRWLEIRWSDGFLADFINRKKRKVEMCEECWENFIVFTNKLNN